MANCQPDQPADAFPWWQVDLVSQHFITGITILNRKKFGKKFPAIHLPL
jgi:hypothetical protein